MNKPILNNFFLALLIFLAGVWLRLDGIGSESFWFDEAATALFTDHSFTETMRDSAGENQGLLYYLGVHAWRGLAGDSKVSLRAYSAAWSLLGLLLIYVFARDAAGRSAALIALLLMALNPLDVYFAREVRMYSQAMALGLLAAWALWRWMNSLPADNTGASFRAWAGWAVLYAAAALTLVHSHIMGAMLLLAQGIFALIIFSRRRNRSSIGAYLACAIITAASMIPWFAFIHHVKGYVQVRENVNWIRVPPAADLVSYLGREFFWGPLASVHDKWWLVTLIPALAILACCIRLVMTADQTTVDEAARWARGVLYLLCLLLGPIVLIWLFSRFYYPVYFRPRFSLLVLPPFLILSAVACVSIPRRRLGASAVIFLALFMLCATMIQRTTTLKGDDEAIADTWPGDGHPAQIVVFPYYNDITVRYHTSIDFLSAKRSLIESLLPYLGGAEIWIVVKNASPYDSNPEWREYHEWLLGLGNMKSAPLTSAMTLQRVHLPEGRVPPGIAGRFDRWYPPLDFSGMLGGFFDSRWFHPIELNENGEPFRWSRPEALFWLTEEDGTRVTLTYTLPPPVPEGYRPNLRFYLSRSEDNLLTTQPVARRAEYQGGIIEQDLVIPPGEGPAYVGWQIEGVNLKAAGVSADKRDLGLNIRWIGVQK